MDGGAEGIQHLHLLQDVLAARGADDQQLATLSSQGRQSGKQKLERASLGKVQLTPNDKWEMAIEKPTSNKINRIKSGSN